MTSPHLIITSAQNAQVKLAASLDQRKHREEHQLFIAEGLKVVATARDCGWTPHSLFFNTENEVPPILDDLIGWAEKQKAKIILTTASVLSKLSTRDNPQTLIGLFTQKWLDIDKILPTLKSDKPKSLWIALDRIRDPGNLGTIIRTADAVDASGIILIGDCCDPYSREAVRASMGSIFAVPLVKTDTSHFKTLASAWSGEIIGTHLQATEDYRSNYKGPCLLLMGSEGPGLSDDLAKLCTRRIKIPMTGKADSLNLAIATALMLYEIRRGDLILP